MRVLVVGGAGYIGSHMVRFLGERDVHVVTLDNLSSGHSDAVLSGQLICGDLADRSKLDVVFAAHDFDLVMHFASLAQVGESVQDPSKYYENNVSNTLNLLEAMRKFGVKNLVFSSTAAVFGEPQYIPIDELHPKAPINPYGRSKLMVEEILKDFDVAYGMKSVCLRYFNAAGAHPDGSLGERHYPETHLIPLVLQVASGRRDSISVFGSDYATLDGTCVRDYVHVMDLVQAHWLAISYLQRVGKSTSLNLGNGNGFSVREVIETARQVTARGIAVTEGARRGGDPPRLVADSSSAWLTLGWRPSYPELEAIIQHAWAWESRRNHR